MALKITIYLFFSMIFLILTSCDNKDNLSVRVAHISWPGYEPLSLAKSRNLYKNINVKTFRPSNNTDAILAFENNIVDVVALTLNHAIEIQSRDDEQLIIIAILDISHGGDVIIANNTIKSVRDLKGKRLGIEPTALGAYFVSRAIDTANNVSLNDVYIIPVEIDHHNNLFLSKKIDAIATYGPIKSNILKQSGHIIFDSRQIPNEIIDVLVTKKTFSIENPLILTELLNGYFSALSLIEEQPDDTINEMANSEGVIPKDYLELLSGIKIPDKNENRKLLNPKKSDLIKTINKLNDFLIKRKIITNNNKKLPQITDQFISTKP